VSGARPEKEVSVAAEIVTQRCLSCKRYCCYLLLFTQRSFRSISVKFTDCV